MYAYQHYNHACLAKHETSDCVFCKLEKERVLLSETATTYAIFDKYPVNEGHVLVIAKRHVSNYFDLSFKEQQACWLMVNRVKLLSEQRFEIDGFNIGVNVNKAAGQTVNSTGIQVTGIVTSSNFRSNSTVGDGSDVGFAIKYYVTADGTSAYRFAGPGVVNTTNKIVKF